MINQPNILSSTPQSEFIHQQYLHVRDLIVDNNASLNGLWIASNVYDASTFGIVGDGSTDNTTRLATALAYLGGLTTGGILKFGPGTFITQTQTLQSNVYLIGAGPEATIIRLKSATNANLFQANVASINLSGSANSGSTGGVTDFGFSNLTLDGNMANQTSGTSYVLQFYGYGFRIDHCHIRGGYTGNIQCDWNGGAQTPNPTTYDDMLSYITNTKIYGCNGIGLQMGGPHDSQLSNVDINNTGSHGLHLAPNASGMMVSNLHSYGSTHGVNAVAGLIESGLNQFTGCEFEGSDAVELVILGTGNVVTGARLYTNSGLASSGLQIGQQAGNTPYTGMILQAGNLTTAVSITDCFINGRISQCEGSNGSVWFANDGGINTFILEILNNTGTYEGGAKNSTTTWIVTARGIAATGTLATSLAMILMNVGVQDGCIRYGATNGSIQALSNGNTITTLHLGRSRVSEAAAVTGIIMQAGVADGQSCFIENTSAFSITFAASGSNVASGSNAVIAASTSRLFVWDSSTSLWY